MRRTIRRGVAACSLGFALAACSTASTGVTAGAMPAPPSGSQAGTTPTPAAIPSPIAWVRATPSPVPVQTHAPIPPGTPACGAGELLATAGWQGATGSMAGSIAVTNTGTDACVISGPPRLVRVDASVGSPAIVYRADPATSPGAGDTSSPLLLEPGARAASLIVWSNLCLPGRPTVTQVLVTLPDGAGPLVAAPIGPGTLGVPRCDRPEAPSTLTAFGFAPLVPEPGTPEPQPSRVVISTPATATVGQDLDYVVTLTNLGSQPASLIPCPSYTEDLLISDVALKPPVAQQWLMSCQAIGPAIGPGSSVRLEMRLAIPASLPPGPAELRWGLDPGGPFDPMSGSARVPLTLLGG